MKDSLCYIYFSCTVYWNINCWRHMSATSSDVRKYTCICGCVHNDAWGSKCESTVGCRITVPATFFWRGWPTSMQLHGCMRHHFVFYVYMDIYLYIIICIYIIIYIFAYIKKKTFSDTCTHIHISDKRDFTLLSILSASSAAQLSNGSMVCSAQPSRQLVATTDVFFFAW